MKNIITLCVLLLLNKAIFAQNTDGLQVAQKNKVKRISYLLQVNTGMSFIVGQGVKSYKKSYEDYISFYSDEYELNFKPLPTASLSFIPQINFNEKIILGLGLNYQYMGWREKIYQSTTVFPVIFSGTEKINYYFHYIGTSFYFRYKVNKYFGIRMGGDLMFRAKSIVIEKYQSTILGKEQEQKVVKHEVNEFMNRYPSSVLLFGDILFDFNLSKKILMTTGVNYTLTSAFKEGKFRFVGVELGIAYEF